MIFFDLIPLNLSRMSVFFFSSSFSFVISLKIILISHAHQPIRLLQEKHLYLLGNIASETSIFPLFLFLFESTSRSRNDIWYDQIVQYKIVDLSNDENRILRSNGNRIRWTLINRKEKKSTWHRQQQKKRSKSSTRQPEEMFIVINSIEIREHRLVSSLNCLRLFRYRFIQHWQFTNSFNLRLILLKFFSLISTFDLKIFLFSYSINSQ